MDRGDTTERPPTNRVGTGGGSGRGLRTVVVLALLALAIAVLKPWGWIVAPSAAPGREGAAIVAVPAGSASTVEPKPTPRNWAIVDTRVVCLSGTDWLAVVDQVDGPTTSRSWTHLDLVRANDPLDPAIVRTRVYADSVPRIGFCAPGPAGAATIPGAADTSGSAAAGAADTTDASARFVVHAWRLPLPTAPTAGSGTSAPGTRRAVEIVPLVISGGSVIEGGSLFGPPAGLSVAGGAGRVADPEGAWAAGGLAPGPARWRADRGEPAQASWPPGTYVFRVDLARAAGAGGAAGSGSAAAGADAAWFAIELRGPWIVPGASGAP